VRLLQATVEAIAELLRDVGAEDAERDLAVLLARTAVQVGRADDGIAVVEGRRLGVEGPTLLLEDVDAPRLLQIELGELVGQRGGEARLPPARGSARNAPWISWLGPANPAALGKHLESLPPPWVRLLLTSSGMAPSARLFSVILAIGLAACSADGPDDGRPPYEPPDESDEGGDGKEDGISGSGNFGTGQITTLLKMSSHTLLFLFGKPGLDAPYEAYPGDNGWEPGASPITTGNAMRFIIDGDDYKRTLLEEIGAAESSVWINVFEWQDEANAREIADALIAARGRGVDVRVVVDNRHSSGHFQTSPVPGHSALSRMRNAGGEVRAVTYAGYRVNHRKIMIFDRTRAIVTGGNLGGNYLLPLSAGWTYHDAGVLLSGPAVADVAEVFANSYQRAGGTNLPSVTRAPAEVGEFADAFVQVLRHDAAGDRNIERELVQRIDAASWRVVLMNGFGMSSEIRDAAIRASERGVSVTWLWGSASKDTALMAQASFEDLRDGGVDIRRYPQPLHMKAYLADDVLIIGSSNLDGFSCWLNDEIALQIESAEMADAFWDRVAGPDLAASPVLVGDARDGSGWRDWAVENILEPIID
jgi:cardiolipin synthase